MEFRQQNEVTPERANSGIGDSIVDGSTSDWEVLKRYEGMTAKETEGISLQEFGKYKGKRISNNAWAVSKELVKRICGAPALCEYINCKLSEQMDHMFFFNTKNLDAYQHAGVGRKIW